MQKESKKFKTKVRELSSQRGKNKKVFLMSDKSERAVFYSSPVHVLNEKTKKFTAVDNTFLEETDGKHLCNAKGPFKARVSNEENDELFTFEKGEYKITVSKADENPQSLGLKPTQHKKQNSSKKVQKLVFNEAKKGVDFEYSVKANGIKENIIVKERAECYRFPFTIHSQNVTAKVSENGKRIAFLSNENGEEVFYIPSPFMTDASGAVSTAVSYTLGEQENGDLLLTVNADSDWINADERAFPVVIDPQVMVSGSEAMTVFGWTEGHMLSMPNPVIGGVDDNGNYGRMYLSFNTPELPHNPRIKKAELVFTQESSGGFSGQYGKKIGLYRVYESPVEGENTPASNETFMDYAVMKSGAGATYSFDITGIFDEIEKGENELCYLVLKSVDESVAEQSYITLYGTGAGQDNAPKLVVDYETTYGVNTTGRTHTHPLGRFGQASVDLLMQNLMFEAEDFAWGGNRMPVTIKHLYNSALAEHQYTANEEIKLNTADFSQMKIGNGYKLNLMQSVISVAADEYVYIDENGSEIYLAKPEPSSENTDEQQNNLFYDIETGDICYNPDTHLLTQGEETYTFDTEGRLIQIKDANNNHMDITYTEGKITSVTDGVGRAFTFEYDENSFLTSITAPDNTKLEYEYEGELLSAVTYEDGVKAVIAYLDNRPTSVTLIDAEGNNAYRVGYNFYSGRLGDVIEYSVVNNEFVQGMCRNYSRYIFTNTTCVETFETEFSEDGQIIPAFKYYTKYSFDNDGNIVGDYSYFLNDGNVDTEGEQETINPFMENGGNFVSNANNLLVNHRFERASETSILEKWILDSTDESFSLEVKEDKANCRFGVNYISLRSTDTENKEKGMLQGTMNLVKGDYTFSVYLKPESDFVGDENKGVYLRILDKNDGFISESEHIVKATQDYTRLALPFTISEKQWVKVQILVNGAGSVLVNAPQLESNEYANEYNMLENGSFSNGLKCWTVNSSSVTHSGETYNDGGLKITSNLLSKRSGCQTIKLNSDAATRETFALSGWAWAESIKKKEREGLEMPVFHLRAKINYAADADGTVETEDHIAEFAPGTMNWQYSSIEFSKSKFKAVDSITVYAEYGYNTGSAYFDNIQLVTTSIETDLTADDFVTEDENETESSTAESGEATTYSQESEDTATEPEFTELLDAFGNTLTETVFENGEFGTIYRSFGYNESGNDLVKETDARGNKTEYEVDETTSRNTEVTDRLGNKTAYEYDERGRTTKVTSKDSEGEEIANVSYSYNAFDNLSEIVRGDGMKYLLKYNSYHNLESIGVDGKTDGELVHYTYKENNGRIKEIAYANGDKMCATYNGLGYLIAEKWYDNNENLTHYFKYVYDGQGNIVRSIDILALKEYNYIYENGRLIRSAESDIVINSDEFVTSKNLVCSVYYFYNSNEELSKKVTIFADGGETVSVYDKAENDAEILKTTVGGKTVTSISKTDNFGRKVFDELQLGTGFVSHQFSYLNGEVTDEHSDNKMLKSSPTTQLVSGITLSDGRTILYEYDAEERITKVIDSEDGVTEYTYDSLGQLLTETVNGELKNSMVYDNYGNILQKNGKQYVYDEVWKDKLSYYDGEYITYDAQGNPVNYLDHTLTWEKGRQLKSLDNIQYEYNVNGIRTSKTIDGTRHDFYLDGAKILRETWDDKTLDVLYDNEETVCGIIYNGTPYFFLKNLQGDIIAITNVEGETVANYRYDAWGKCEIVAGSNPIADVNPFRYRGYYYDKETGLYYLQSRYYDPEMGRFLCGDDAEFATISQDILQHNLFAYCKNNVVNESDENGMFSFNDLFKKISGFIKKLFQKFMDNLKKQIQITRKYIKISVTVIKLVLDLAVSWVVNKFLKWGIEKILGFVMKKYIQKSTKSFVQLLGKILNHSATKWLIKALMLRAVNLGYVRSTSNAIKSVAVDTVLSVSKILSKINSICSACSSISGFIAFILDLADRKWDDYLTIKFA